MKKTETLYSYLYKKSNKMWAVKYKFHKKDAYKNTSLGTRNKREAERKKRRFDLNLIKMGEDIADIKIRSKEDVCEYMTKVEKVRGCYYPLSKQYWHSKFLFKD